MRVRAGCFSWSFVRACSSSSALKPPARLHRSNLLRRAKSVDLTRTRRIRRWASRDCSASSGSVRQFFSFIASQETEPSPRDESLYCSPVGATGYESGVSHHTCPWLDYLWSSSGLPGSEPRQLTPSEHQRDESLTSRMELFSRSACRIRIPRPLVRRICINLSGNHLKLTKRTDEQRPRSTFDALSIGSATSRGMRGMP